MQTVVPSLFPFFFLSGLLTCALSGCQFPILRPLGKLCGVPAGAESYLLAGLVGGYPVGAQTVYSAYNSGLLNKTDAEKMLGYCNHAGPGFLFGICGLLFENPLAVCLLWLVQILSALLTAVFLKNNTQQSVPMAQSISLSPSSALKKALTAICTTCGWIILFRIFLCVAKRWMLWLLPKELQVLIIGITELSNGCIALSGIADPSFRFVAASCFLGSGGLCVLLQTLSVIGDLNASEYVKGKLLQTAFCFGLSTLICPLLFQGWEKSRFIASLCVLSVLMILFIRKICKISTGNLNRSIV